jgi:hypothetical protein
MVKFFTPPLEPLSLLDEEQAAENSIVEVSRAAIVALRRRRMIVRTCIPFEGCAARSNSRRYWRRQTMREAPRS